MIEGRRQAVRKQRDAALGVLAAILAVAALAVLVTSAQQDQSVRDLIAFRVATLALVGSAIAICLAYIYRARR